MKTRIIFRLSRTNKDEGYLSIRMYYLGKSRQIATGLKLRTEEWDANNSQIVLVDFSLERRNYLRRINIELENKVHHLNQLLSEHKDKRSIEAIIQDYRKVNSTNSFHCYVQVLINRLENQKQFRTAAAYKTTAKRFLRYNNQEDFSLNDINCQLIESFERHLYEQSLSLNTISFYMRNLRAIYNRAIQDKLLMPALENPFARVYTGVKSTPKRALSKGDLQKLHTFDVSKYLKEDKSKRNQLLQAKDLFLFSFHARGMSFVDIVFLKKTDIKNGIISYRRRKTGQQLDVRVSLALRNLINKYSKLTADSVYLFPIIQDKKTSAYKQYITGLRKQNICLKHLQKLTGITKTISTHVARHSWATIAKEENLPIWTISESLGHSSVKTIYIYLASINRTKLDEANDIVSRAVGFY